MINRNLSEDCDRRVNRRRERGRWASGATGQRGCQPTTMSSRVPAGGGGAVGCQPVSSSRVPAEGGGSSRVPAWGGVFSIKVPADGTGRGVEEGWRTG